MNWKAEIPDDELELLCEYLDDALSVKDRAKFEKRLQRSPELTEALEDMAALKHSMRSLPCKPVPHHFTLTRSEAQKARRGRFLLPTFGWASVVSMMLLAVILGSEFIFSNFSAPQAAPEAVALTMQDDVTAESVMGAAEEKNVQPVYLLNWVQVGGKGGAGGGGGVYDTFAAGMGGGQTDAAPEIIGMAEPLQEEEIVEPTEAAANLSGGKTSVEPLIFGVREDQLGQVITVAPVENPAPMAAAAPEVTEQEKAPLIDVNVKLLLAGLTAVFGLIWLLLRLRR